MKGLARVCLPLGQKTKLESAKEWMQLQIRHFSEFSCLDFFKEKIKQ